MSSHLDLDKSALAYCLKILEKKDYSQKEIYSKLKLKGFDLESSKSVIQYLIEKKFIDDNRLAENILEFYSKTKGRAWIEQKMQLRGLSKDLTKSIFESLGEQFELLPDDKIKSQLARKYDIQDWANIDPKDMQKILGWLARRGYSSPWNIIKSWQTNS